MTRRTYSDMIARDTFLSRAQYLMLEGKLFEETFGSERYMNQIFYTSHAWKQARDVVILRDNGCDLGVPGHEIHDKLFVHHIEPVTVEMLRTQDSILTDPENLVTVSRDTHQALHYGNESMLPAEFVIERKPGDHIGWERMW